MALRAPTYHVYLSLTFIEICAIITKYTGCVLIWLVDLKVLRKIFLAFILSITQNSISITIIIFERGLVYAKHDK